MSALDLAAVSRDAVLQAALKRQLQLFKTQRQPTYCNNCAEHFEQLWDRCVHGSAHSSTRVDWLGILLSSRSSHNGKSSGQLEHVLVVMPMSYCMDSSQQGRMDRQHQSLAGPQTPVL